MRTAVTVGMVTLTLLGSVWAVSAQELTAEVRTWGGQTIRLSQPTLEVFYTLLPQDREVPGAPAPGAEGGGLLPDTGVPSPGGTGYGGSSLPGMGVPGPAVGFAPSGDDLRVSGSMASLGSLFGRSGGGRELVTAQGRRQRDSVSLFRGAVETRVSIANLATLTFTRRPPKDAVVLPPYVLPGGRFQYGATAIMTDGSTIDGDYVNLGTTLLRGTTPQGRVDIPWDEIAVVRFLR
jgi:hypothetical protein